MQKQTRGGKCMHLTLLRACVIICLISTLFSFFCLFGKKKSFGLEDVSRDCAKKNKTTERSIWNNAVEIWVIVFLFFWLQPRTPPELLAGLDHVSSDPWNSTQAEPQVPPVLSSMACLLACLQVIFPLAHPSAFLAYLTHRLTTKIKRNELQKKKEGEETHTFGSRPCAFEVRCLFWSYLKAATEKAAGISQPSLPPFLASSPHTHGGQSSVQSMLEWRHKNNAEKLLQLNSQLNKPERVCGTFLIMHAAQRYIALPVREIAPSLLFLLEAFIGFLGDHVIWHH